MRDDLQLQAIWIGVECRIVSLTVAGLARIVCRSVQDFCAGIEHSGMNLIDLLDAFRVEGDMLRIRLISVIA